MIHFGYQVGLAGGWKWGVDGTNVAVGTLPAHPNSQSESTSAIGLGHSDSGSYWKGGIASVRFYDRLLSDVELFFEFERLRPRYLR